jgi:serine/threonine protein kinase
MTEMAENGWLNGRLNEVLAAYLEAADAGWAPDRHEFVTRYPELADELESYFRDQDHVAQVAESLPHPSPRVGQDVWAGTPTGESTTVILPSEPTDLSMEAWGSFGDYEIRSLINKGGMGVVFKAYQKSLKRDVALKMIGSRLFASQDAVRWFIQERCNNAILDHPNIVPVYEGGEYRGQPYFTMKLVEGGDMGSNLPRLRADLKGAMRLLAQVARAVHHAHERGILHRDLKPGNVLLEGKPDTPVAQLVPLVSDFGLAKRIKPNDPSTELPDDAAYIAPEQLLAADGSASTTASLNGANAHAPLGTPGFIPPEQVSPGTVKLTTAADIYGLGAILYKLLTGRPPHVSAKRTDTVTQIVWHAPEPPRKLQPNVDRDLEAVCLKCLREQPEQRYRSALELAEELERWGRKEPVQARRRSWPVRAWRAARRHALLIAITILAGFVGGAAFAAYYVDPDRPRREDQGKIAKGKSVTLIGEMGPPRYSRLVPFEDMIVASTSLRRPFSYESRSKGRLELLSNVPAQGYRFSAKVLHEMVFPDEGCKALSDTGIYFAYATKDQESCWCQLAFADRGDLTHLQDRAGAGKTSEVELAISHCDHEPNPQLDFYQKHRIIKSLRFHPEPGKWRTVAVEVRPESIRAFWGEGEESVEIGQITPAELLKLSGQRLQGLNGQGPKPQFEFAPQGGLGLFVNSGAAAFRDVVIEPLK